MVGRQAAGERGNTSALHASVDGWHLIAEWWSFGDATIEKMGDSALDWWRMWKPVLRQLVEVEAV